MLKELLKARVPAIFIRTLEELRVDEVVASALQEVYSGKEAYIVSWNPIKTSRYFADSDIWAAVSPHKEFGDIIREAIKPTTYLTGATSLYMFYGIRYLLDDRTNTHCCDHIYRIMETIKAVKARGDTLIFVGGHTCLPEEISKLFYVYDMPLPTAHEIMDIFKSVVMEYTSAVKESLPIKTLLGKVEKAAYLSQGLTLMEAESAFSRSLQIHGDIDYTLLIKHKAATISQSDVLELISVEKFPIENLVGFDAFRKWLELRATAYTVDKEKYPLEDPKGCLLIGHSGVGKSMAAKAIGNALGVPVIRFDFSRIFRSLLGDSEALLEKTLLILSAIGRCVCWLDEINLSMGGASSSSISDSGVMLRLLQMFLTWSQDRSGSVFIVATGNSLETLPPMLYRKGRMDAVWFCGLPDTKNRMDLFSVHLMLKGLNPKEFPLGVLAGNTDSFSGAEIEHVVNDALFMAASEDKEVNVNHLLDAIAGIKPNSSFSNETIRKMVEQFSSIGVLSVQTGKPIGRD